MEALDGWPLRHRRARAGQRGRRREVVRGRDTHCGRPAAGHRGGAGCVRGQAAAAPAPPGGGWQGHLRGTHTLHALPVSALVPQLRTKGLQVPWMACKKGGLSSLQRLVRGRPPVAMRGLGGISHLSAFHRSRHSRHCRGLPTAGAALWRSRTLLGTASRARGAACSLPAAHCCEVGGRREARAASLTLHASCEQGCFRNVR